ncbi:unnamed protein product [Dovyalis caffra]|uniref:Uncharacterized protein n=1 Tax=Dovyalis caffra TaxID=77055 RepID=A0AAV1RTT5_9ROSI|nr:unnamed protein product [Dovyalis caffra]
MEMVHDDTTSSPSILESKYPKKKPEARRIDESCTTCQPNIRTAEELWAIAYPHKTATVPTTMGGIKGDTILTRLWKY